MRSAVGIELAADRIRAVRVGRRGDGGVAAFETSWDPERPAEAVAALRADLGAVGRLAVAVDLALLYTKHVRLPPVPTAERRRMLALEPERYFPVRGQDLLCTVTDEEIAFAVPEARAAVWIAALQTIAPVVRFEPAPLACARALAHRGRDDAWVLRNDGASRAELVEIRDGRVRQARLVFGGTVAARAELPAAGSGTAVFDLTDPGGAPPVALGPVAPAFLAAYGAALDVEGPSPASLLPAGIEAGLARRRRLDRVIAASACAAALGFAMLSLDAARARSLRRLDTRLADARVSAAPALSLQAQVNALARESRTVATLEGDRADPLRALRELTAVLPRDAFLRAVRANGNDWEVDGYAPHAGTVVPLIENAPHFEQARLLGATSRVQLEGRTYESFSLAFRVVRSP